jgi:hypothetical protein
MASTRHEVSDRAAERELRHALNARNGEAALSDLVISTGLPQRIAEQAVSRLIDRYEGAICVAKGGALYYCFAMGPFGIKRRREDRALWRAAMRTSAAVSAALVRAFEVTFRAVLALQLLVYAIVILTPLSLVAGVIVGIVVLLVIIFSGEDVSGLLELLTDPYGAAFVLFCSWAYGTYLVFQKKIEVLMAIVGRDERGKKGVAGFIAQINDFALGPDAPPSRQERIDRAWRVSQDDERRILERIRRGNGSLRAGHLVAWLGLDFAEAEREATRIAVEHGGVPGASAIDVLEFRFESLDAVSEKSLVEQDLLGGPAQKKKTRASRESQRRDDARTRFERGVSLPRLTANTLQENLIIATFGLVNMTVAWVADRLMTAQMLKHPSSAVWWHLGAIAGGKLPFAFSLLLFAVFMLRVPLYALRTLLSTRAKRRATWHRAIVDHVLARGEDPLDLRSLGGEMDEARRIAVGLEGSFDLDSERDPSKVVWRFRRLAHELAP